MGDELTDEELHKVSVLIDSAVNNAARVQPTLMADAVSDDEIAYVGVHRHSKDLDEAIESLERAREILKGDTGGGA